MGLADLGLQVGIPDLGGAAQLLQVGNLLTLAGVLLLLLGLVLELAVVEVFADRGGRGWGDLYEVKAAILCLSQGFGGSENAKLVPLFIQNAHLWDADLGIDA
jgi:hypothetical protein